MVSSKADYPLCTRWNKWLRAGTSAWLAVLMVACGGSNSDPCGLSQNCETTNGGTGSSGGAGGGAVTPVAADMTLQLSAPTVLNSGGDTVTATVTVVDANRNLVAKVPVTFTVDNNATAAVPAASTNAVGVSTATIGIGSDRSNRVVTVTATSGSLSRSAAIQVTGARIVATPLPATLPPGATGLVRFRLTDVNSNPIRQQDVTVAGVGGVEVRGRTDDNGSYEYSYTAPTAAGPLSITANAAGVSFTQSVQVQLTAAIPPAISSPPIEAATVSLSSAVVPANVGATNNLVEVRALFLRETNRPAERVRVRFDFAGDTNNIPGQLSTGGAIIYSDSTGIARTTYTPGVRSSPVDGVTVRACWDYVDFAAGTCPNQASARLTVVSEPLSVSIGTDNKILLGTTNIDYVKRYLVQVNDASGGPKADVQLSTLVDLQGYYMGFWQLVGVDWHQRVATVGGTVTICENEDINRNAANEVYVNGAIEDTNANGQLDPRKGDVIVSFEGNGRTDATGQAVIKITYPQSVGSWVSFRISVIAGGTGGSEGRASFSGVLPVLAEHVISQDRITPPPTPAFVISPYNPVPYRDLPPSNPDDIFLLTPITPTVVTNPDGQRAVLCRRG